MPSFQFFEGTHGVNFHMQSKVEKIVSSEENPSQAGGVIVNGQTIPADLVIMGVGVAPASDFLKNSGIELERDGGVKVDEFLRVESLNNVYAIGKYVLGYKALSGNFTSPVAQGILHIFRTRRLVYT
jgi:NADPH-dependent 2,4-dienoyl-CoA reductase/sulfur reductase-like enzyme